MPSAARRWVAPMGNLRAIGKHVCSGAGDWRAIIFIVLREDSAMDHLTLAAAIVGVVVLLEAGFIFVLGPQVRLE